MSLLDYLVNGMECNGNILTLDGIFLTNNFVFPVPVPVAMVLPMQLVFLLGVVIFVGDASSSILP